MVGLETCQYVQQLRLVARLSHDPSLMIYLLRPAKDTIKDILCLLSMAKQGVECVGVGLSTQERFHNSPIQLVGASNQDDVGRVGKLLHGPDSFPEERIRECGRKNLGFLLAQEVLVHLFNKRGGGGGGLQIWLPLQPRRI